MKAPHPWLTTLLLLAVSTLAWAHPGSDGGAHHDGHIVLAALTSLVLAISFRRVWVAPVAFVGALTLAALLGVPF